jgi:hypothetical protein
MTPSLDELKTKLMQSGFAAEWSDCIKTLPERPDADAPRRLVCSERIFKGPDMISFWLLYDDPFWIIGLWSPKYYRMSKSENVVELCLDILGGKHVPKGRCPTTLPATLLTDYNMEYVGP